jgi:hypothetical protein
MKFDIFSRWCDILDRRVNNTIKNKEKLQKINIVDMGSGK